MFEKRLKSVPFLFKLVLTPYDSGSPADTIIEPLTPLDFPFLITILIIPPPPSASYRADGLVITSTFSTASAGNNFKASATLIPANPDGFPSINIFTFSFPLRANFHYE